ncbi:MAG TPA: hypothetical protein VK147_02990, partial [Candidatus Didemnitutus sp.]|nr:hypothetical protein [Candidatus Didemnitutus sp.]
MLLQQIRDAALAARKAAFGPAAEPQWRKDLLVTLLSEAEMFGKNEANRESTDEEVIGVIKKFLK